MKKKAIEILQKAHKYYDIKLEDIAIRLTIDEYNTILKELQMEAKE